jgi:hypothetical protein
MISLLSFQPSLILQYVYTMGFYGRLFKRIEYEVLLKNPNWFYNTGILDSLDSF